MHPAAAFAPIVVPRTLAPAFAITAFRAESTRTVLRTVLATSPAAATVLVTAKTAPRTILAPALTVVATRPEAFTVATRPGLAIPIAVLTAPEVVTTPEAAFSTALVPITRPLPAITVMPPLEATAPVFAVATALIIPDHGRRNAACHSLRDGLPSSCASS